MRNIKRFLIGALAALIGVSAIAGLSGCSVNEPVIKTTTSSEYDYYNELTTAPNETNTNSVSEHEKTTVPTSHSETATQAPASQSSDSKANLKKIPAFSGNPYITINNNIPGFTASDMTTRSFEKYSELDSKRRCGVVYACIGKDLMPTGERGEIGQVKPTGWHTVKYDCVDGKYLYNRCHLIGWQLTGENANERNLITGTRYMNVDGMLPFENMVADYIKETGNHVLYRVTPIYEGSNLVANGVQMEAYSVEDDGEGICFNVYCYNAQPQVKINYADGTSSGPAASETTIKKVTTTKAPTTTQKPSSGSAVSDANYIININTGKFHYPSCGSVDDMSDKNKEEFKGDRQILIDKGYSPCGRCHP